MRPVVHAHDEHVAESVGSGVDQHVAEARAESNAEYTCPMHPEVRQNGPGKCPKCGMFLEPVGAASAHGAHRHAHHVDERHRQHHATPAAKGGKDVEYTCPMHPQVRQMGPGNCPICGMALEPVIATGETGESPELRDMTRRFWIGLGLTLPVFVLEMGGHVFDIGHLVGAQTSNWIQMVLATPVVLWAGWPFFVRGWASVKNRSLNMFTLIALGTGAAWLYSMVGNAGAGLFPPELRGHGAPSPFISRQQRSSPCSCCSARCWSCAPAKRPLAPSRRYWTWRRRLQFACSRTARTKRCRSTTSRLAICCACGPARRSLWTARSRRARAPSTSPWSPVSPCPWPRLPGSKVTAGTMNQTGGFVMRAEKVGADTLLSQIVHMVAAAQRSRAPIQRMADQVAGWFVPVVIVVALLTFVAWLCWGPSPAFSYALITAVAVLIIACPCALGLATPMSIMVGVGRGAQHGVLIRDAEALERMEKVDTLVVDKTGTLTEGRPKVVHIEAGHGFPADDVLQKLASVERASEHPLAMAVVGGPGAQARVVGGDGLRLAGRQGGGRQGGRRRGGQRAAKFLAEHGIDVAPLQAAAESSAPSLRRSSSSASAASWPASWPSQTPSSRPRRRRSRRYARPACAS